MKNDLKRYGPWGAVVTGWLVLFLFFMGTIPYILFYKEQTSLFLCSWVSVKPYLTAWGGPVALAGDFLTQFYYYEGLGAAILSTALVAWGAAVYRLFQHRSQFLAWVLAILLTLWEAGRGCQIGYSLQGTLALAGWGWTLCGLCALWRGWRLRSLPFAAVALLLSVYLWGGGQWNVWTVKPDVALNRMLALDCEYHFGRRERLAWLLQREDLPLQLANYYRNLMHATAYDLPAHVMESYQTEARGLFLPVSPQENYFSIYAANEAWFAVGDYTMAEHAAMLGMIFSPRHTGSRALRRLAEINLINGDEAAAMKYLRMLDKTLCHRRWARQRMAGSRTPAVSQWIAQRRQLIPEADMLRSGADAAASLRHLLRGVEIGTNPVALDYLLCHDLMLKDIASFVADYKAFAGNRSPQGIYAEGVLIYLAGSGHGRSEIGQWNLPDDKLKQFMDYSSKYEQREQMAGELQRLYGNSYWFYYHFAKKKGGKE